MSKWNFDGIYIVAESDGNEVLFSKLREERSNRSR